MRKRLSIVVLCCILLLSGCAPKQPNPVQPFVSPQPMENTVKITLYFGDDQALDVIPERREVQRRNEPLERLVLRELIKGPSTPEGRRTLPAETKLISVDVVDRIAYANFSRELVTRHPGGSAGERMTILSIVYTLTELPGIEKVQLLLEGEKKEAMFGHGTTIDPIGRPEPQIFISNINPAATEQEPWFGESPPLAGDITAISLGNMTGTEVNLVAFAGGELYIFEKRPAGFDLLWSMPLDRDIRAISLADLNGDGRDELLLAGAVSGNSNPNVPGFLAVYAWQDGALSKVTDMSRDTIPFWGVGALDVTGDGRPEVLVSNSNATFILEWKSPALEQIHAVTRFSGVVASSATVGPTRIAWRDANGSSIGVFSWSKGEWATVFRVDGQGEWTDSVPSIGDLTGDGRIELAILDLRGFLNVFDSSGNRLQVDAFWQEVFATEDGNVTAPVIARIDGRGYLVYGQNQQVKIRQWH